MEIFAIFFTKMDNLVNEAQSHLGLLVSGFLVLEIIWFGIDFLKGKQQDFHGVMWKTVSVCLTLFICANITDIANIFLNSLIKLTGNITGLKNINIANPILEGWNSLFVFWKKILKIINNLFWDVAFDKKTGETIINPNYTVLYAPFKKKIADNALFMIPSLRLLMVGAIYFVVGVVLGLVLIYGFIIFYIALIEYRIILLMSSIFIIFTIWQPTKFLAQNVLSTIWANIVKLFTLNFIIMISVSLFSSEIISNMNSSSIVNKEGVISFTAFGLTIIKCIILGLSFYMLITKAPKIANGFLSGQTSLNTLSFGKFLGGSLAVGLTGASLGASGIKAPFSAIGAGIGAFKDKKSSTGSTRKALGEVLSSGAKTMISNNLNDLKKISSMALAGGGVGNFNKQMFSNLVQGGGVRSAFNQGKVQGRENYHNKTHNKQGELNRRGKKDIEHGIKNRMKRGGSV